MPRIDGEQVDADFCSLTRLYRVHVNSAKIALEEKVIFTMSVMNDKLEIHLIIKGMSDPHRGHEVKGQYHYVGLNIGPAKLCCLFK